MLMRWQYVNFSETANANGDFVYPNQTNPPSPFIAPISGRILKFSVETSTGCRGRNHEATIVIRKVLRANEPTDEVTIGPFIVEDCTAAAMPVNYQVESGRQYTISGAVVGFDPSEVVSGKFGVSYLPFGRTDSGDAVPYGYVRVPQAEEAARQYLRDNFQNEYWQRNDWDNQSHCNWAGDQNDGLWKREWAVVDPNLDSLEIWVDFNAGRGYGHIDGKFSINIHYIQWTCGIRDYDHQISPRGHVNLTIHIDVSSGNASVHIDADIGVDDVGGIPDWADNAVGGLVQNSLRARFEEIRPDLERRIASKINGYSTAAYPDFLRAKSALEAFGIHRVIKSATLFDLVQNDAALGLGQLYLRSAVDELNQEYIARQLNAQRFPFTVDYIDGGGGLFFRNLQIQLVPQVIPGQVRILTAPHIVVILDSAHVAFSIAGETNLFQSGHITIEGDLDLSFLHNYQATEIEFRNLVITRLSIQEGSGFETFVKNKLNQTLPSKVSENHDLLQRVATLLNTAITNVIGGRDNRQPFISYLEFQKQLKLFGQFMSQRPCKCGR